MDKVKLLSVSLLLALVVGAGFGVGAVQGARSGTGEYLDSQTQEYVLDLVTRSLHEGEGSRYRDTEEERHLFTHVAAATEEIDSGQGASTSDAQEPLEPLWWATLLGDRWEFPWEDGRWHRLTVWSFPFCHGQQYHGPGGYQDTCESHHGCIDAWTWWLLSPESKLGVSWLWSLCPLHPGRRQISSYSAVCWVD